MSYKYHEFKNIGSEVKYLIAVLFGNIFDPKCMADLFQSVNIAKF